jgi:hypothetical protein
LMECANRWAYIPDAGAAAENGRNLTGNPRC